MATSSFNGEPGGSGARERALVDAAWEQVVALATPPPGGSTASAAPGAVRSAGHAGAPAIPGYRILGEVQRGGQGVVYLAVQESTRRKVAVKVLRHGPFAGAADLARFEREVDLLARLRHPGIVAVHDRGVAAGCPYLVMDYVPGRPLEAWLADGAVTVRQRLGMFGKICGAVHAAHLVGIIHRDLKPANIRVDEAGEPRVLDFGLAKLADDPAPGSPGADLTREGQFVGSLPWASPEQAEGRHDATDVRTDVYSLGVVLFFMLTGRLPYPESASARELTGHIVGTEPIRPGSVRRELRGDVETIVLKCLAKEPARRYQSAGEVARDVGAALAGRPIDARRDSAGYVLRKMLERHWAAAAAGAAFIALLAGTAATTTVLYRRAAGARAEAQSRLELAQREATKAAKVGRILGDLLAGMSPWEWAGANNARVLEALLDRARERIDADLRAEPEVRASIDEVLGAGYLALNNYAKAEEHLVRSLEALRGSAGEGSGEVAAVRTRLAGLRYAQGKNGEAEALARAALDVQLGPPGTPVSNNAAMTLALLAELRLDAADFAGAESFGRRALDAFRALHGDSDPVLLPVLTTLGVMRRASGRLDEAEATLGETLRIAEAALPPDHPRTADAHQNLGALYTVRRDNGRAERHLREALRIRRAIYDGPHEQTAMTLTNLAALLSETGRYDEAERSAREAIEMYRAIGSPEVTHTVTALVNLASALRGKGDAAGAEAAFEEARARSEPGYNDQRTVIILNSLAMLRKARGDFAGAEEMDRAGLELRRSMFPEGHVEIAHGLNNLGDTLVKRGDAVGAESALREAVAIYRAAAGERHVFVGNSLGHLGRALLAQPGKEREAAAALAEAIGILLPVEPDGRRVLRNRCDLAEALVRQGRFAEAEAALLECERSVAAGAGTMEDDAGVRRAFVRLYEAWGKPAEAETWRAGLGAAPPDGAAGTP